MVELNGLQIEIVQGGNVNASGPPVIVTPAPWGIGPGYILDGLRPLFDSFNFISFVPRGTSPSQQPVDPAHSMSTLDMVADVEALRTLLGLETMVLLGHCWSGTMALLYAENYPTRVSNLILLDTCLGDFDASQTQMDLVGKLEDRNKDFNFTDAVNMIGTLSNPPDSPGYPRNDKEFAEDVAVLTQVYFYDIAGWKKWVPALKDGPLPSVFANTWNTIEDAASPAPANANLGNVTARTCMIAGEFDIPCPLVMSQSINKGIKGSTLTTIPNAGHLPWVENSDPFYEALNGCLSNLGC